jgi:hypothetical protein
MDSTIRVKNGGPGRRHKPPKALQITYYLTCYDKWRIKTLHLFMARKFGNHLFRNRQALGSEHPAGSPSDLPVTFGVLDEQVIILGRDDIRADAPSAPLLDWSTFEKGFAVQLKDTEGLDVGSVTIKASTLQRTHPALLPVPLESEYLFSISLKTVVLQVQAHLRQGSEERPNPIGPDFDTPIAQVAREDEGFFKLAQITEAAEPPVEETAQAERKITEPMLTPADRPTSTVLRKKFSPESKDYQPSWSSSAVTPSACPPESLKAEMWHAERIGPNLEAISQNSLKRIGLERLREIFMTEDHLDAPQVAHLLAAFPKVNSAMVMLGDGSVLGGNVPDGCHLETALRDAPVIMRSVQEFNRRLRSHETSAFTLLGDPPVTLFAEGRVYILISHEGRGLLPGVRQRIGEVARALDAVVS